MVSIVQQLEGQLEDIKYIREQADKAVRLAENPLFRELILEGFCRDEMARLAAVSGDPAISTQAERDIAADMSRAGGHLKRFLNTMIRQANTAVNDIPEIEAALAEARAAEAFEEQQRGNVDFTTMGGDAVFSPETAEGQE